MLSDCNTVEGSAESAAVKESWLRLFFALPNDVPLQGVFLRIFRLIDPKQFEVAFRCWVGGIVTALDGQIAIDGKTLRGSADAAQGPVPMVSAFHTELSSVLGQEKAPTRATKSRRSPSYCRHRTSAATWRASTRRAARRRCQASVRLCSRSNRYGFRVRHLDGKSGVRSPEKTSDQ